VGGEVTVLIWERDVLRTIFGPISKSGCYRMRINKEAYRIYQELDLVTIIKTSRLKWLGHINRMKEEESATGYSRGGRRRENPRKIWLDDVEDDLRKTGVKRWRINAMKRTE
jgi:hypothetical protein